MTASQIVETYHQYIVTKCRQITRNKSLSEDLSQDCCLKILSMDDAALTRLKQHPEAYIYRILASMFYNHLEKEKTASKYKSELLYIGERTNNMDEFTAVARLSQTDQMVLSVCINYPDASKFSRKTKISRPTSTKLINELKDKLSQ